MGDTMFLKINHRTRYTYKNPIHSLTQCKKLFPSKHKGIKIINWNVTVKDAVMGAKVIESNGDQSLVSHVSKIKKSSIVNVKGEIKTIDTGGILEGYKESANPEIYLRNTKLTRPNNEIKEFVKMVEIKNKNKNKLSLAHMLKEEVHQHIEYSKGSTKIDTPATQSFKNKKGVCQDFAHLFISSSICVGIPARYVVGYLESSNNNDEATHAWAELYFKNVGWIAFDPTHNCCTNEKYVRICSGFDSLSAAPIRGVAIGSSEEKLNIKVSVDQVLQQ